jgi:iron complex outermembrane receptor protein
MGPKTPLCCATALAGCLLLVPASRALAQDADATIALPSVDVTSTRLVGGTTGQPARRGAPSVRRAAAPAPARVSETEAAPGAGGGTGTGTGAGEGAAGGPVAGTIIVGASSSVITAADIARSPGLTVQDVLAREPGIQVTSLFGGVNGAQTTVDMRGFGATSTSNTLVLINGRRLNDIDLAGVDFSTVPKESIERIEITRGNSGGVLYGDGAVGGVINIVTKNGVSLPTTATLQGALGSFNAREATVSASTSAINAAGQFSGSVFGNAIDSDGYRENNKLHQRNAIGDLRWNNQQGTGAYLTLGGDDQHLGLPGGRLVSPAVNLYATDPRGATTPFDFANKQGASATAGVTHTFFPGTELVVDGGVRQKNQQAAFFCDGCPDFDRGAKSTLTTASLTPRLSSQHSIGSTPGKLLAGIDLYDSVFGSDRSVHLNDPPNHRYDLTQDTAAGYFLETIGVLPTTDLAFGARLQNNRTTARDRLDVNAPGGLFADPQGLPLDQSEWQHALHIGIEHRLNPYVALFGRAARSFRLPTVDERVGVAPVGFNIPTNFDLKTQTSHDAEAGVRFTFGTFILQSSVYGMDLENELFFSPATFTNVNLDPTRRYGWENAATWQATETLRFKAGLAYTRAAFREGPFAGNDVPLVSRWTGSVGVSWNIYQKLLVLDAVARFFGPRRMDNDSANLQLLIPAQAVVDVRIGGAYEKVFWSFSVQNLFDVRYYEYAISSIDFITNLPNIGTFSAYPLPGRTFMAKAGVTW